MSRILVSSLLADLVGGCILYNWWSTPVRKLVNSQFDDVFQTYIDVSIAILALTCLSCLLAFGSGHIFYCFKRGHQPQQEVHTLDNALTLKRGQSSDAFLTLTDGTEILGQITRYDNVPETPQLFIEIGTPYYIKAQGQGEGEVMDDNGLKLLIPALLIKTLEIQVRDDGKSLDAEELRAAFLTSKPRRDFSLIPLQIAKIIKDWDK